jgi:hydrogenase maturation protease
LGIGNILLRDEGVGVRVIETLQAVELTGTVEVFDGATAGVDLVDVVAERRKVIVIDAVQADEPPGTIFRFTPAEVELQQHPALSLHQVGFLEALRMTQLLGCAPDRVVIFGVRPKDVGYGLELSQEVSEAVPKVVELVLSELQT